MKKKKSVSIYDKLASTKLVSKRYIERLIIENPEFEDTLIGMSYELEKSKIKSLYSDLLHGFVPDKGMLRTIRQVLVVCFVLRCFKKIIDYAKKNSINRDEAIQELSMYAVSYLHGQNDETIIRLFKQLNKSPKSGWDYFPYMMNYDYWDDKDSINTFSYILRISSRTRRRLDTLTEDRIFIDYNNIDAADYQGGCVCDDISINDFLNAGNPHTLGISEEEFIILQNCANTMLEAYDPERAVESQSLRNLINNMLDDLKERQRDVIILRYGLIDGHPCTLDAIGREFHHNSKKIREIESTALRKLRNPVRARQISEFYIT